MNWCCVCAGAGIVTHYGNGYIPNADRVPDLSTSDQLYMFTAALRAAS
jgi:hypothetical protein